MSVSTGSCVNQRDCGNVSATFFRRRALDGELLCSLKMQSPFPPLAVAAFEVSLRKSNTFSGEVVLPPCEKRAARSGSYRFKIEAWAKRSVPPLLSGWRSFPSILVGRPSLDFTNSGMELPRVGIEVA